MKIVFLAALGVGGATVFGSILGFCFKTLSRRSNDLVLSFAAGVMLAASILGLVLPALDQGRLLTVIAGLFTGAACIRLLDRLVPHLQSLAGICPAEGCKSGHLDQVLLFVAAIAIHNLPEGIAAGVSFGSEDISDALLIAGGIALQNIPEGMVIIAPMLGAGISPRRTFLCALATGLIEVVGTFLGYFAVTLASRILPFALAFAGGTMLYVILDEMIPEAHAPDSGSEAAYSVLAGFCLMLIFDSWLG